ncbi:MAG: hypothetical protein QOF12_49 [Solirubrobacteraceae bacterium]|nr:hypothetical protein [Solirubrobacteraceae bacterium]
MSWRHPRLWRYARVRRRVADRFVAGEGLEIGALHSPFPVPASARVRYVDRMPTARLRAEYPELAAEPLVEVDVVEDGETLAGIAGGSQDFVIASHFLEHCEDPIGALEAHLRVLRPGGVLLLALPDRRRGIDARRAPTPVTHLLADHADGGAGSRAQHYREWAELVDLPLGTVGPEGVAARAAALQARRYAIHFHAWTLEELAALLEHLDLPAAVVQRRANQHEFLVVLRRS